MSFDEQTFLETRTLDLETTLPSDLVTFTTKFRRDVESACDDPETTTMDDLVLLLQVGEVLWNTLTSIAAYSCSGRLQESYNDGSVDIPNELQSLTESLANIELLQEIIGGDVPRPVSDSEPHLARMSLEADFGATHLLI